jgi:hypothetical protein
MLKHKLLFEPDRAVSFFLLEYQELLKGEYQKTEYPPPR